MRHVNWPSRPDVISTTVVVTVTVAFFGVYFFLTDSAFSKGIGWLDPNMQRNIPEGSETPEIVPVPAQEAAPSAATSKHWYIVHTYWGFEKKVKESLEGRVAAFGLTDKIGADR